MELLSAAAVLLGGLAIMRRAPRGAAPHARRWKQDAEAAGCDTDIQVRPPRLKPAAGRRRARGAPARACCSARSAARLGRWPGSALLQRRSGPAAAGGTLSAARAGCELERALR